MHNAMYIMWYMMILVAVNVNNAIFYLRTAGVSSTLCLKDNDSFGLINQ